MPPRNDPKQTKPSYVTPGESGNVKVLNPGDPPLWEMMKQYAKYKWRGKKKQRPRRYTWLEDDLNPKPPKKTIDSEHDKNSLDEILGLEPEKIPEEFSSYGGSAYYSPGLTAGPTYQGAASASNPMTAGSFPMTGGGPPAPSYPGNVVPQPNWTQIYQRGVAPKKKTLDEILEIENEKD